MLLKLSQEKLDLVKKLFIKWQPNNSALWCYLNGDINGETYVDNMESPTKAICVIFWGWGFVSDNADIPWIENQIQEICRTNFIQIIWNPKERPEKPEKGLECVVARYNFIEYNNGVQKNHNNDIKPLDKGLFEKCQWKEMQLWLYQTPQQFLDKTMGFCAVQENQIVCEAYATFIANNFTELGVITNEKNYRQGLGFSTCSRLLEEVISKGLKPTWSCDQDNPASINLARKLGFQNPIEYEILVYPKIDN